MNLGGTGVAAPIHIEIARLMAYERAKLAGRVVIEHLDIRYERQEAIASMAGLMLIDGTHYV
jgi:hypothetical protein